MTDSAPEPTIARWSGDLLWPTPLPAAAVIDATAVTAWGVWIHDWLRQHPGIAVIGDEQLRDRLRRADLPVRWYRVLAEARQNDHGGVTASERAMLWE